jgi:hypothetical protein
LPLKPWLLRASTVPAPGCYYDGFEMRDADGARAKPAMREETRRAVQRPIDRGPSGLPVFRRAWERPSED